MVEVILRDHMDREHVIHDAGGLNQVVAALEHHRQALADRMLGSDRAAAILAEHESDQLEEIVVPRLAREVAHIAALLDDEAADEHRRAKAHAIKARGDI
jgi:hypothetical protein